MSGIALTLGPVAFKDFEIPAGINFGGQQILAIHQLSGGGRVVDVIGPCNKDISFAGTISGDDATARARLLDALRVSGAVLLLAWDTFFYTVIVRSFHAEYEAPLWIPYSLSCVVLDDATDFLPRQGEALELTIGSCLSQAKSLCGAWGIDLSGLQALVAARPGGIGTGAVVYHEAQTALAAQAALGDHIGESENTISFAGSGFAHTGASEDMISLIGAAQALAELTVARGYLGRVMKNLDRPGA